MYPNIPANTVLWCVRNKQYSINEVNIGDIVLFKLEKDGKIYGYIWRVIGVPGDEVLIKDTDIYINNERLNHVFFKVHDKYFYFYEVNRGYKYLIAYEIDDDYREEYKTTVPEDSYYLMGDNRDNAADSRYHGVIKISQIYGKTIKQYKEAVNKVK